jgi:hypothetical protein
MLLGWSSISNNFSMITVHASRLFGHNTGVLQLDAMAKIYAVFNQSQLIRIVETNVLVVLFYPGFS